MTLRRSLFSSVALSATTLLLWSCGGGGVAPRTGLTAASIADIRAGVREQTTSLKVPIGIAVDSKDDLYVANGNEVAVFTDSGKRLPKLTIKVESPADIAFDSTGDLYVSRFAGNSRSEVRDVYVFNQQGKRRIALTLHTLNGVGWNPSGIAFDSKGEIWVANRNGNDYSEGVIQIFNGTKVVKALTDDMAYPLGIGFSATTHDAWIGDAETPDDELTVYNEAGKFIENVAAASCAPGYVAFAKNGDLYVPCTIGSNAVQVYSQKGSLIKTITDGLDYPIGLAFDHGGNFFVSNAAAGTVTKYNSSGKLILTIQ